jgi:hypothetical protein
MTFFRVVAARGRLGSVCGKCGTGRGTLLHSRSIIDLVCGPGFPITSVLVDEGLHVFGVDAAPSFAAAFQRNLPGTPILCEAVQVSRLFDRSFDAVLVWGLMFLLKAEEQYRLV